MVNDKRAQLFLLAAVIISVVVLSLGVTVNRAVINREPEGFYEFSYEVQRESSAALDYDIYTNIEGAGDLTEFTDSLIENVEDREPDANFIIISGDNVSGITIISKWVDFNSTSVINVGRIHKIINNDINNIETENVPAQDLVGLSEFVIEIEDQSYSFPVTEYYQIVFIMQKEVEDESHVSI